MGLRSAAFALLAGLACAASVPPEKLSWHQARSAHFHFVTDGGEAETRERATALETLGEMLRILSPDLRQHHIPARPQPPTFVYLFTRPGLLGEYSSLSGVDGVFARHVDGFYVAVDASRPGAAGALRHECLHRFLDADYPGLPAWINEGLACFFQTLQTEGGRIRLGDPPDGYLPVLLTRGIMPAAELLPVRNDSPTYLREPGRSSFYATAWLFTDFLLTGGEARMNALGAYLDLIRTGRAPEESFRAAFGRSPQAFDAELGAYLAQLRARRVISTWNVTFSNLHVDPAFTYGPLAAPEALGRLGLLLLTPDKASRSRASQHFDAALARDPSCFAACLGRGILARASDQPEEAADWFGRACRSEPDDAMAHYLAGAECLRCAFRPGGDRTPLMLQKTQLEAMKHLARAVELDCPDTGARALLVAESGSLRAQTPEAFALLERVCRAVPGAWDVKLNLAMQYQRASQAPAARALLAEIRDQTQDAALAEAAARSLRDMDALEAGSLQGAAMESFKAGKYEEAVAGLEKAIALAPDPAQKRVLQESLDNMKVLIDLRLQAAAKKRGARKGRP